MCVYVYVRLFWTAWLVLLNCDTRDFQRLNDAAIPTLLTLSWLVGQIYGFAQEIKMAINEWMKLITVSDIPTFLDKSWYFFEEELLTEWIESR